MKKRYIKVQRNDTDGYYIQPLDKISSALDGETDGAEVGTEIKLTIVEMTDDEYAALSEFAGW